MITAAASFSQDKKLYIFLCFGQSKGEILAEHSVLTSSGNWQKYAATPDSTGWFRYSIISYNYHPRHFKKILCYRKLS